MCIYNSLALKIISIFFFLLLRVLRYCIRRVAARVAGSDLIKRLPIQLLAYFIIVRDNVGIFFDGLLLVAQQTTLALFDDLVLAVDCVITRVAIIWREIEYIDLLCEFLRYCGDPVLEFFARCAAGIIEVFYICLLFLIAVPVQFFSYYVIILDIEDHELCVQISLFIFDFTAIFLMVAVVLV